MNQPLSVVAVVKVNDKEALVLNRGLDMVYFPDRNGGYIGIDGPFIDVLAYSFAAEGSRFAAFAGRELSIQLFDGSMKILKNSWWGSYIPGTISATYQSESGLADCYVFYGGACAIPSEWEKLRATYDGPIWEYRAYQDHLKSMDKYKILRAFKWVMSYMKHYDSPYMAKSNGHIDEFNKAYKSELGNELYKVVMSNLTQNEFGQLLLDNYAIEYLKSEGWYRE